jgi:hypothetical protein
MKVSSPIGELPFVPTRVRFGRRGAEIDGLMGAWPAHVHVDAGDLPALVRALPRRPLVIGGSVLSIALLARRRRR